MKSWKARLLLVFVVGALTLAVSVPAMASHSSGAIESMFGADGPVSDEDSDTGDVGESSDASVLPYYCNWPSFRSDTTATCSKQPFTMGELDGSSGDTAT